MKKHGYRPQLCSGTHVRNLGVLMASRICLLTANGRSSVASTQGGCDEDVERNVASEGLGVDALFSNAEQFGAGRRASSNCAAAERYVVFCGYAERSTWPR